jgi:NitT/TauT family transport system permease protein
MNFPRYDLHRKNENNLPNIWDIVVFTLILGALASLAWAATKMAAPFNVGQEIVISLSPKALPLYGLSTVLRMLIAMLCSLLVTFTIASLAVKNKTAEKIIMPLIDIMQSIPVLGMLSITLIGFIKLFPNSRLGPECAAIFAIFTSQVWNMILSLYQSLKTVPKDLSEVATMYHLSKWQKFWKIEVPFGTPALLWNTMVSMSAGWFFVVISETIQFANQTITLPGIGSYIAAAITQSNMPALLYAIAAMFIIILLYDQLIFRPLLSWAEKFKDEIDEEVIRHESWFFDLLTKTKLLKLVEKLFDKFSNWFINLSFSAHKIIPINSNLNLSKYYATIFNTILYLVLIISLGYAAGNLLSLINTAISLQEVLHVFYLGVLTSIKVVILIILASLIWVPAGVFIGFNPRAASIIQPLIQFAAAFPANLFYPLFVIVILRFNLNQHIWTMPLMILGTQWYILFNVIGGTSSIPKDIKLATQNFGVTGFLRWRKLILPAIFPYYVTGAMAAAGGCWNACIVAEYVEWGQHTIISSGLGSYITKYTHEGDFARIALGIGVMCIYVMLFNRILWQKLYELTQNRFSMS